MPELEFLDNRERPIADALNAAIAGADEFTATVAFVKRTGLLAIRDEISGLLVRGGSVKLVYGVDFHITDPAALRSGNELKERFTGFRHFVFYNPALNDLPPFHPKVYLARNGSHCVAIVGSSNLTKGGLNSNVEACVRIEGTASHPLIREINDFVHSFALDRELSLPSETFLVDYEVAYRKARKARVSAEATAGVQESISRALRSLKACAVPTQTQFVAMALVELVGEGKEWAHGHSEIRPRAEELMSSIGIPFNRFTFVDNIRRILGENTVGKPEGKGLFERRGGLQSHSGYYRLTDAGRRLALKAQRS